MPQSLASALFHITFSTKNRARILTGEDSPRLWEYIAKTAGDIGCTAIQVGGHFDHIHALVDLGRTTTLADLVSAMKVESSKLMKREFGVRDFAWQSGYGAFSLGEDRKEQAVKYILNQEDRHRVVTFQEEYRGFLERAGISWDEDYVWD